MIISIWVDTRDICRLSYRYRNMTKPNIISTKILNISIHFFSIQVDKNRSRKSWYW